MLFRLLLSGLLLFFCLGISGCYQGGEGQADDGKNSYFLAGKERVAERDYKGAIEAFEKALETSPHSAQAHFELGVLYEQHSDQKEEDYVSAMYHYNQAIRLRPNDYPADNARQRIMYCKRELVKAESLAPVAQNLMRELDKLKEDNKLLRKQLESAQAQSTGRIATAPKLASNRSDFVTSPAAGPKNVAKATNIPNEPAGQPPLRERITLLPPLPAAGRTHTVKAGETVYSISRLYHVKPDAILSANPALDPKRMKTGQVITIPSA